MILYLGKFSNDDFAVGTANDTSVVVNNNDFVHNKSIYYEGSNDDISSLVNVIHQLFKKYIEIETFQAEAFDKIVEFIEYQSNNYGFDISECMKFIKHKEKVLSSTSDIFACFIYGDHNTMIGLYNSFDELDFKDKHIDKEKSIIIKFISEKDAKQFFRAIYLLTKNINNKLNGHKFTITYESIKQIQALILGQSRALLGIMDFKIISLSENKVTDFGAKKTLNSDEVCRLLNIDRQKLAYWRKTSKIKFRKFSDKKFSYQKNHVYEILENMMIIGEISYDKSTETSTSILQPAKVNARLEKLKKAVKEDIIDYTQEIKNWFKIYTFKVVEHKYDKQKFFLNFGNVGMSSSPQVMINDDYQLIDYIKKIKITNSPAETWDYIQKIQSDGLHPRVDSSKSYYPGYKVLYLNNLRETKKQTR